MSLEVRGVVKRFGTSTAVDGVDLTVPSGSLAAVLGPSGSGKTTLLRIIAGLDAADAGRILLGGVDVTELPARRRGVGVVFQHYALFRHMTVRENVAFPLTVRGRPRAEIDARVGELLRLVRLEGLDRRSPAQLSGGQRQRVALARALAPRPSVLLLDEPFGALDPAVRLELRERLRELHDGLRVASLLVTHDREDALALADRVAVMSGGRLEQAGTPDEVYERPASELAMRALGQVSVFGVEPPGGSTRMPPRRSCARPFEIDVDRRPLPPPAIAARVARIHPAGPAVGMTLIPLAHGAPFQVELARERLASLSLREGDVVHARPRRLHVFPERHDPPEALRLALRRGAATAEEAEVAAVLARGPEPADRIAERLAEHAYRKALTQGGAALDVGLWGRDLLLAEARRRVAALVGDLLEEVKPRA